MNIDPVLEERGDWLLLSCDKPSSNALFEQMKSMGSEVVVSEQTLLMKREVLTAIGPLDQRLAPPWLQADFVFRARRAGFNISVIAPATLLPSFQPNSDRYLWWRGWLLFMRRNFSKRECLRELASQLLRIIK